MADGEQTARERVTVVTLARRAGVAASTVSRALKGDTRISAETRQRIEMLAMEAGYMPSAMARTLSGGRSGLVGLVLGSNDNPFYAELMHEAVSQVAERGLRLLLLHAGGGPIEDRTAEALLHYQVDGCLITSAELSSRASEICADHKVPVIMVNRVPRLHSSAVACDNYGGGQVLAALLLKAGHRHFAVVRGNATTSTSVDRERGFADVVQQAGASVTLRVNGLSSYAGGYAAGLGFAAMSPAERPEAVFCVADIMAMGAIDALRSAGLRVPDDVSIVSFDGIEAGGWPPYALTTIKQPLAAMIGRGLDLLVARLDRGSVPDEVVSLRGDLVIRSSARLAPHRPKEIPA
jgi:DNA-binding LacI/PurR family transcriptional regulator